MRPLLIILLLLASFGQGWAEQASTALGTVRGQLQVPETERYSGVVSLWDAEQIPMPDPRKYVLIPSMAGALEPDGRFLLRAPPGRYYLGAILRHTPGPPMGPPRPGDRVLMTPDAEGEALVVEVAAEATVEVGLQGGGWIYQGFSEEAVTGISGELVDAEGLPQQGLLVFAFLDPEMSGQPLAVSARTGADGRYLLRLPGGGEVYLRVRDNYGGGAPVNGGIMGVYGKGSPRPVAVVAGKVLSGINIPTMVIPATRSGGRDTPGPAKGPAGESLELPPARPKPAP